MGVDVSAEIGAAERWIGARSSETRVSRLFRRIAAALVLFAVVSHNCASFAWNDTGHMTVALIAYRRLSDAQKHQVGEILKRHPHYQSYLLDGKPAGVDDGEWAFLKAATWPDFVRPGKPGSRPESITKYHHGPWHYIDIPFVDPRDKDQFDPAAIKAQAPNVLTELPTCVEKLSRSDTSAEDRAVNLAWVEHLIGDMHQPLHCIMLFSEYHKQGDMGGNALAVRMGDVPINLHAYWDCLLGNGTNYTTIDFLATTVTASPVYDPEKMPELKQHESIDSWANESYELGKGIVYNGGELHTASWRAWQNGTIKKDDIPPLPEGYEANARALASRRIALAGYRLEKVLAAALH
jgi:hypothetical protein